MGTWTGSSMGPRSTWHAAPASARSRSHPADGGGAALEGGLAGGGAAAAASPGDCVEETTGKVVHGGGRSVLRLERAGNDRRAAPLL